ncbi:MAG: restriction endonuclease subunit S [Clostridia bacterium]|nr:restriction endonuclease subunit S [Clostridia bacterium]
MHLNQIAESSLGKTLDKAKNTGELCQYLCSINVYWDGISLETVKTAKFTEDDKVKYRLKRGDLLICEGGDVGRSAIWDSDGEMYYQNALHRVRFYRGILSTYFRFVIECYKGIGILDEYSKGMTIKHLVQNSLYAMWLPLPPLAEQKRIVAKIEELLPLVDRYEKAWTRLEEFNKRFPGDMQKSILQMAIQGKLVEQRPEEGTGEELYQQIQKGKQALIKAGKIKKEKPLPEITEEEIPFDIPETWKWVMVGAVCMNIQYGSSQKSSPSGKIPVLRMGNIQNGRIVYDKLVYTSDDAEIDKYPLTVNDLLFNRTNSKELVGKTAIYKGEMPAIYAGYLVRVTPVLLDSDYLNFVMQSQYYWTYCQTVRSDAIGQSNINAEKLKRFIFPLPPFAEQKRIVARLEELLPLCGKLK